MKSIVLAGGSGRRLYPLTVSINKHLLPIHNKPMVYYPLSFLISAGFKDIILVSSSSHIEQFARLLGDGTQWGISIEYVLQEEPHGIAHALRACEPLIRREPVCVILGDNLFLDDVLPLRVEEGVVSWSGAQIFIKHVPDPRRYGVALRDENGTVLSLEEKPGNPQSNYAVTGLYLYDSDLVDILKDLQPSSRGEFEITAVNQVYLSQGKLRALELGSEANWIDAGTPSALQDAAEMVKLIEERRGHWFGCPELSAYKRGFIERVHLSNLSKLWEQTLYGDYLAKLLL